MSGGYKRVNYYELCRLCASSQPKDKIHIFRDEGKKIQLQQKIQSCFPLLVCEHDYLPKVVCVTCIETLEQCYNFRQNCMNSETMLSSYFSNFRFTDDFKKAGKVYVKDTGQTKQETINQQKKNQENQIVTPIIHETPYFMDVPVVQKPPQNIPKTIDVQSTTQHALMYIDIDQLIDAGLPEQEVNKLKDVLLKPGDNNDLLLNNNNNNNNNNDQIKCKLSNDDISKIFKCETCEKIFKRREHLYQHSKLHTGIRPFCCPHCTKTFSRKEHLLRHLTSHSGAKDYACDVCNKKFSRPDNLKKHKKTHQKSGPFICDVCAKSFVIKHYYLAHKLQHDDGTLK